MSDPLSPTAEKKVNPKFQEALQRFESVEVKGDRVLIRSRPAAQ